MINKHQELTYNPNILGVLAGMVIGGLVGAVTMLLMAPQSGKRTRVQIQEKGIELRDRATKLLHQGQELVADQIEYVTDVVKAGKKAIQSS